MREIKPGDEVRGKVEFLQILEWRQIDVRDMVVVQVKVYQRRVARQVDGAELAFISVRSAGLEPEQVAHFFDALQGKDAVYPVLYGTYTGNCAVEIPLCGSGRTGNTLGKILNAGSQIAAGFAESPAKGAIDIYNAAQSFSDRTVNKSGANDVNSGCLIPYQCRLDIERREVIRTEDYADLNGVPAFDTVKISEISGFVKVQTIDLSGITCEQSERDELRRLLEKGVYI